MAFAFNFDDMRAVANVQYYYRVKSILWDGSYTYSPIVSCNVENAALGSTICAERTAIVKAVSEGRREFVRIAVYGEGEDYCMPCGSCRQVMSEFARDSDMEVLCTRSGGRYVSYKLSQLLPHQFKLR